MAQDLLTAEESHPPTTEERLAPSPMNNVASALRRVVPHAQYSDDQWYLYELAKLADGCGMLSFGDFCHLVHTPSGGEDNAQVGRFFRELQSKAEDLETQVREKSDELAQYQARAGRELEAKQAKIQELEAALSRSRSGG